MTLAKTEASPLAALDSDAILKLATGDTSRLNAEQKTQLIVQVCQVAGLDPRLSPFEFIKFQGKEVMYARKNAADQLVNVHKIKVGILSQEVVEGVRVVTVSATSADGREQQDIGAVNIKGLAGDALANAMMKAVTKAKRRTILSICGLSMLDESEVETIPGAVVSGKVEPVASPVLPGPAAAPPAPAKGSTSRTMADVIEEAASNQNIASAAQILDAEIVTRPPLSELRIQLSKELIARGMTAGKQVTFVTQNRKTKSGDLTHDDYDAIFSALGLSAQGFDSTADVPF